MEQNDKRLAHNRLIEIGDKWVSEELTEELFACDIVKCKGACCVEGDLGAPVEKEELAVLDEILPSVFSYMRPEGRKAVNAQGSSVRDFTGNYSTPLVEGKECAYVTFKRGIALCAIEQAYQEGKIEFQKPISCHLYPVRVRTYKKIERLIYDRWDICKDACSRGEREGIPVYQFVKDALIRKYGEEFFQILDEFAQKEEN